MYEFQYLGITIHKQARRVKFINDKLAPKWETDPSLLLGNYLAARGKEGWSIGGVSTSLIFLQRPLPKQ